MHKSTIRPVIAVTNFEEPHFYRYVSFTLVIMQKSKIKSFIAVANFDEQASLLKYEPSVQKPVSSRIFAFGEYVMDLLKEKHIFSDMKLIFLSQS